MKTVRRNKPREFTRKPQKRFLKVVIAFGRDIIVLQILLTMERDGLCFDFTLLYIHLVSTQHDRNVFTHTHQITVPVGNILVGNTGRDIKHDDGRFAANTTHSEQQ